MVNECAHCGWSQKIVRERGKLVSVEVVNRAAASLGERGKTP
jgi:hypothetical protein